MDWCRLRCRAICASGADGPDGRALLPGSLVARCCWRLSGPSIPSRKGLMGNCPTSMWVTWLPVSPGSLSVSGPSRRPWCRSDLGSRCLEALRLLVRVRENEQEQDQGDDREHAKSGFLAVPCFGLPHEEPFGADAQ